jgi:hypothetical protein
MALDRTWFNSLVDDDGSGLTGSVWDKADVDSLMDAVDAELNRIDTRATSGQIVFPATQVPSSNPNTLDDYREGSWTPTISGASGGSGQIYSSQFGRYVKVGRLVLANGYVALSQKGTLSGNIQIAGFPFPADTTPPYHAVTLGQVNALATPWASLSAYLIGGGTPVANLIGRATAAVNVAALTAADLSNTTDVMIQATYLAAQ